MHSSEVQARLDSNSDKSGECWLWVGLVTEAGRGRIDVNGKNQKAHRVAFELAHGPVPNGLEVDHKCRNRLCVKPDHLQAVTHSENMQNRSLQANSTTGIRGVVIEKRTGRYVAQVQFNGRKYFGGSFITIEEAERAVVALRNKLFTNNLEDRESAGRVLAGKESDR